MKKKNGHRVVLAVDQMPQSKSRKYKPTVERQREKAMQAVLRAFRQLSGASPAQLIQLIDASLKDEFTPLPKLEVKHKGSYLDRAMKLIEEEKRAKEEQWLQRKQE